METILMSFPWLCLTRKHFSVLLLETIMMLMLQKESRNLLQDS